jgi:tetratricopeptide (TPR) repeat protein
MKNTVNSFLIGTFSDENRIALPVKGREGGISSRGFYHGLIISSGVATTQHEQKLIRLAEIAYGQRNIPALEKLSAELCSLPSDSARDAGMYYAAIVAKRNGQVEFARSMLESLVDSPTFSARATQTLGALYYDIGNTHQAMPLFAEAARSNDIYVKYVALMQVSSIKSTAGEHRAAIEDIERLLPLARVVSGSQPHLFYCLTLGGSKPSPLGDGFSRFERHAKVAA